MESRSAPATVLFRNSRQGDQSCRTLPPATLNEAPPRRIGRPAVSIGKAVLISLPSLALLRQPP